ncbi:MAG: AAA family ATPase [Polyangiales bacterium]
MKPLEVTLENFGPYTKHTVDLTPFVGEGLFLIHGDTGAGKSTILDAVAWALYARGLAQRSAEDLLRARGAAPDEPTRVTLTFAIGDRVFRVTRAMDYERAAKRGGGVTRQRAEATLECLSGDEGFQTVTTPARVNREVEALLQLPYEQFSRVIVLPQGEFRELLLARAEDRERLLERIFGTERYAQVEERLRRMASEAAQRHETLRAARDAVLSGAGVESEEALRAELDAATAVAKGAGATADALRHRVEHAEATRDALRRSRERNEERARLRERLARWDDEEREARTDRERLDAATRAAGLSSRWEALDRAREALVRARSAVEAATEEREAVERRLAGRAGADAERALESELAATRERARGLEAAVSAAAALAEAERRAREATEARTRAEAERDAARASREAAEAKLTERSAARDRKRAEAADLSAANLARQSVEARLTHAERKETKEAELRAARRVAQERARVRDDLARKRDALRDEALQLAQARRAALAAELAAELVDGDPCPVCGSDHHPSPATGGADAIDDADARAATARVKEVEHQLDKARDAATRAAVEVELREREVTALTDDDPATREQLTTQLAEVEARVDRARRATREAEATEREIDRLRRDVDDARASEHRAATEREGHDARATELEQAAARLRAQSGTQTAGAPPASALDDARRKEREVEAALAAATRVRRAAEREAQAADARREVAVQRLHQAEGDESAAVAAFETALAAAGFTSAEQARGAEMPESSRSELRRALHERDRARDVAVESLRALGPDERDAEPAREAVAEVELEAAREALADAQAEVGASAQRRAQLEQVLAQVASGAEALREAERRHATTHRVSELANGRNEARTRLSRWVLLEQFDKVVACASARLEVMSDGRFQMHRREVRQTGREFDLAVDDAYTGAAERPVASLSGGEMFLASLAMALGLGDVLQAWSGGVRVESLFVDEGFGTLDEDALDKAVSVLERLPEASRMVGVVSHVPELRKRIAARLEVVRGEHGSVTRCSLRARRA